MTDSGMVALVTDRLPVGEGRRAQVWISAWGVVRLEIYRGEEYEDTLLVPLLSLGQVVHRCVRVMRSLRE